MSGCVLSIPTDKDIGYYVILSFMGNLLKEISLVPKDKKLIVFDLDGTLTESKSDMDMEMAELMASLLEKKKVAVIGGANYETLQSQFLFKLQVQPESLKNLFLFPTTATIFYRFNGNEWEEVYRDELTEEEKKEVLSGFENTFRELGYRHPEKIYGDIIEDRGTQITFSALGNKAPLEAKEKWNKENQDIRSKIEKVLQKNLPDMEAKVAGLTSIDVTRKGVDKGYGIKQINKHLDVPLQDMLFVGDAFSHESNDEAALKTGVLCFEVKGTGDTKELIKHII